MKNKKASIIFLLGSQSISGGTNVIFEHAAGLQRRGYYVVICTEYHVDYESVSWHPYGSDLIFVTYDEVSGRRFDVAIATWWRTIFNLNRIKANVFVYFCQSIESRFYDNSSFDNKTLIDFSYRLPLPIITESTWIAKFLTDTYGRTCFVVPNGIRKELFGPLVRGGNKKEGVSFLVEGPLGVPFKNTERAIELCASSRVNNIGLLTSSPCKEYPGVNSVFSQIPQREISTIYGQYDVLVKLSVVEGMFGPPLEMFHCGGTAISYKVTGHEDYMIHDVNSLLLEIGDEIGVRDAIKCIKNSSLREELKKNAMITSGQWPSWDRSTDEFEKVIKQILKFHRPSRGLIEDVSCAVQSTLSVSWLLHAIQFRPYDIWDMIKMMRRLVLNQLSAQVDSYIASIGGVNDDVVRRAMNNISTLITPMPLRLEYCRNIFLILYGVVIANKKRLSRKNAKKLNDSSQFVDFMAEEIKSDAMRMSRKSLSAWDEREIDFCVVRGSRDDRGVARQLKKIKKIFPGLISTDVSADLPIIDDVFLASRVIYFPEEWSSQLDFPILRRLLVSAFMSGAVIILSGFSRNIWRLESGEHYISADSFFDMPISVWIFSKISTLVMFSSQRC